MYAVHFLLPFVVAGILVAHLLCLHVMGSGSPSTCPGHVVDGEPFLVYYYKDAVCRRGSHVAAVARARRSLVAVLCRVRH